MKNLQRSIRVLALIALFVTSIAIVAQESTEEATAEATEVMTEAPEMTAEATEVMAEETAMPTEMAEMTEEPAATSSPIAEVAGSSATVVGSGVVNPVIQSLIDASGSIVDYSVTTTGTMAGFEQFCGGMADVTTSIRTISVEEDAACRENGIEFLELLIGYDISVFVANPEDDFLTCLTSENINTLFAPSASGSTNNWSDIALTTQAASPTPVPEATVEVDMLPDVTVLLPEDITSTYASLDSFVSGLGLRSDVTAMDESGIISTVASTTGAIGVVSLEAALAAGETVSIVNVDNLADAFGCETPSAMSVEAGSYALTTPLYVYIANNSQATLAFFLDYVTGTSSSDAIVSAGYSPVSSETLDINRAIVTGEAPSRAITAEEVTYDIQPNMVGNIDIVGATSGFTIANANAARLGQNQQTLTINVNMNGQAAGIEAFCSDMADILFITGNSDGICDGAVDYTAFPFGQQAVVLVSNAGDGYATCLTTEQIRTIWSSTSSDSIQQWANVSDAFPEQDLTLLGISAGNVLTDILLTPPEGGAVPPARVDVAETNGDPLYRAAAVANVSGALTYMSWSDYQRVVENEQANIQLVAIDTGGNCVVPSLETISDGSYALARSTSMLVKQSSLATTQVQSYVWTVFTNENYAIVEALNFVDSLSETELAAFRTDLLVLFDEAEVSLFAAEATPEVTAEATEAADE